MEFYIPDEPPEIRIDLTLQPSGNYFSNRPKYAELWGFHWDYPYREYRHHPAAKVIETGYFCPKCGRKEGALSEYHICHIGLSDRGIRY